MSVRRGDRSWTVSNLHTTKIDPEQRGLSVGIGYELDAAVVSDVEKDSPAARANVPSGRRIVEVGGQPAANWSDVHRLMLGWLDKHSAGAARRRRGDTTALVPVTYESPDGDARPRSSRFPRVTPTCSANTATASTSRSTSPAPPSARRAARSRRSSGA